MARKYRLEKPSGRVILLVDDSFEYCEATQLVLEHEGHQVITSHCGKDAIDILKTSNVDLVLLDYFMPEMTGEEIVVEIRKFNPSIQIILQTGYASENPSRDLLRRLNIQGYHDKSEGTEKLLLWVDVGLKAAATVDQLNRSKKGLNYILDITPEMHKIQPMEELLQGILWQFSGLLGFNSSFLAVVPKEDRTGLSNDNQQCFLAMAKENMKLRIYAGIGRFNGKTMLMDVLDTSQIDRINSAIFKGTTQCFEKVTLVPLQIGNNKLGVIYLEKKLIDDSNLELINVFANQASLAIYNAQLYELATRDQLTGVYVRRYFLQLLIKEIRSSLHLKKPLSLMLFDLDNLKKINDTAGHSAGDRALEFLANALKMSTRTNDVIGRYGGDEFTIILPDTGHIGAINVAERVEEMVRKEKVYGPGQVYPITGSIGIATLEPIEKMFSDFPDPIPHQYFKSISQMILKNADEMLYIAKNNGRNQFKIDKSLKWISYTDAINSYDLNCYLTE